MTTKDEALKMAMNALEFSKSYLDELADVHGTSKKAKPGSTYWHVDSAITACREALAQKDEQEPVAEITADDMGRPFNAIRIGAHFYKEIPPVGTKLYTAPPKPTIDKRVKVKLGGQYGFFLDGNWFYLQPADEFANAALYKHTGVEHDAP